MHRADNSIFKCRNIAGLFLDFEEKLGGEVRLFPWRDRLNREGRSIEARI